MIEDMDNNISLTYYLKFGETYEICSYNTKCKFAT